VRIRALWASLGILSLIMGFLLFSYKYLLKGENWHWIQFRSLETAMSVAVYVGLTFVFVVVVEHWWK
jgi:hypothetical protein